MADDNRKPSSNGEGARNALIESFTDAKPLSHQFWTQQPAAGLHIRPPKAQFRFKVHVPGLQLEDYRTGPKDPESGITPTRAGSDVFQDGPDGQGGLVWYCKSVDKPGIDIDDDEKDHGQVFGVRAASRPRVTTPKYKPVNMVVVDPYYPNATRKIARLFRRGGLNDQAARNAIIKKQGGTGTPEDFAEHFIETVGEVRISQLDERGNEIERWTLYAAYPDSVDFGKLDYSSNDLVEISLKFYYSRFSVEFPKIGAEEGFEYFKDNFGEVDEGPPDGAEAERLCKEDYDAIYGGMTPPETYEQFKEAGNCSDLGIPGADTTTSDESADDEVNPPQALPSD